MIETFVKFEECINNCLLSRLSKLSHEHDYHPEYQARNIKLENIFPKLIELLENVDFNKQQEIVSSTLYSLLILYLELKTEGPWNAEDMKTKNYPTKLDLVLKTKYGITFEELLLKDRSFYCAQEVFDKCIKELHQKMTLDDFKKYPGLVEVYCVLINNVEVYNVTLNPVTVLPVALRLVDDYIISNKLKGLKCCAIIMKCLNSEAFAVGNYYEVVFTSLKNVIYEKHIKVTKYLLQCFPDFLKLLPSKVKKTKLDDVFSSLIDQLQTETNLYRKAICFDFTTKIMDMHGVHCVRKKAFKYIICDNLDICSNEDVSDILLQHVLESLQMWIRHCWCIWKLSTDQNILSSLIKILYLAKDESTALQVQNLILTLIKLCSKEEQKQLYCSLESVPKGSSVEFVNRINTIKDNVCI